MADEQVVRQLKERVAFLEALVMSLVARNESSPNPAAAQANAKPNADQVVTQASTDPAINVQTGPATTVGPSPGEVPYLMKLPPNLRADILERVLQPLFAAEPHGLTPRLPMHVTRYTSRTRFPAVLQVNQILRTESMRLYLGLAQTIMADLESENKKLYNEHKAELEPTNRLFDPLSPSYSYSPRRLSPSEAARETIARNFKSTTAVELTCNALLGSFDRK